MIFLKEAIGILLLTVCSISIVQLQETEEFATGDNETSFSESDIVATIGGDLSAIQKMPEDIKEMFYRALPFIHIIRRPENVTDGGATNKCCGRYGCFTIDPPFGSSRCRPIYLLPDCQDELKVKFYLWTRDNPTEEDIIDPEDTNSLRSSHFREGASVVMYINGYLSTGLTSYAIAMKNAILNITDSMFISVDWTAGSHRNFTKSVANSQVVSAVTAYFIQQLQEYYNVSLEDVYLIGSDIGAHIAGGVGKRIPNIGRITGLNPSKGLFEGCDSTVRLARSDANFVDIIHTDIEIMGTATPYGHLDIYFNGGSSQPACYGFSGCDHPMCVLYFIESITPEPLYYAYECDSYGSFMMGKCDMGCGRDNSTCAPVGYHADKWKHNSKMSPTVMFLANGAIKPYFVFHYFLRIECADDRIRLWRYGRSYNKLFISILGKNEETDLQQANENSIKFSAEPRITTLITSDQQISVIKGVKLKLVPDSSFNSSMDCHQDLTEPEDDCCNNEIYNSDEILCFMCPVVLSSIHVKNFESNYTFSHQFSPSLSLLLSGVSNSSEKVPEFLKN